MLEIALDETKSGVFQKEIAENQKISIKYLDQIIRSLKTAGLIVNVRGKKSGYILTRKPSEITMLDIHNAFEPGICVIDCFHDSVHCELEKICKTRNFWRNLNKLIHNYFKSVTLEDVMNDKVPSDFFEMDEFDKALKG
jgi:Rrf2 family protein